MTQDRDKPAPQTVSILGHAVTPFDMDSQRNVRPGFPNSTGPQATVGTQLVLSSTSQQQPPTINPPSGFNVASNVANTDASATTAGQAASSTGQQALMNALNLLQQNIGALQSLVPLVSNPSAAGLTVGGSLQTQQFQQQQMAASVGVASLISQLAIAASSILPQVGLAAPQLPVQQLLFPQMASVLTAAQQLQQHQQQLQQQQQQAQLQAPVVATTTPQPQQPAHSSAPTQQQQPQSSSPPRVLLPENMGASFMLKSAQQQQQIESTLTHQQAPPVVIHQQPGRAQQQPAASAPPMHHQHLQLQLQVQQQQQVTGAFQPSSLSGEDGKRSSGGMDAQGEDEDLPPGSYDLIEMDPVELLAEHTHFCEICGKGFKRDANLRMHMRGHGDEYKSPAALARPDKHLHELANARPKRFSCPYIGCKRNMRHRKFQALKTMLCVKNHYRRSHCPKMLTCSKCGSKKFSVVADLKTHEKHCGKEKWMCSCGTTFSRKDKLQGHLNLFIGHQPAVPLSFGTPSRQQHMQQQQEEEMALMDQQASSSDQPLPGSQARAQQQRRHPNMHLQLNSPYVQQQKEDEMQEKVVPLSGPIPTLFTANFFGCRPENLNQQPQEQQQQQQEQER